MRSHESDNSYQVVPGTRLGGNFKKRTWLGNILLIGIVGELERSELNWTELNWTEWRNSCAKNSEWTHACMNESMEWKEWMYAWMNECMNDWVNERANERTNERTKEGRKEGRKEGMKAQQWRLKCYHGKRCSALQCRCGKDMQALWRRQGHHGRRFRTVSDSGREIKLWLQSSALFANFIFQECS